jgi:hypothetical protein
MTPTNEKIEHDVILLGIGILLAAKSLTTQNPYALLTVLILQISYLGYYIFCQQVTQTAQLSPVHPFWGKMEYLVGAWLWLMAFMYMQYLRGILVI